MHGTGQFTSQMALCGAGSNVALPSRHFDVAELLDTVQDKSVMAITIVGDAFAKPILAALDAEPDRWDISSVVLITSSGVMWSQESKDGLLRHNPNMILVDAFSSSEAIGLGQSISTSAGSSGTAKFGLGANARVITDDGRTVEPGSGEIGRVAVRGYTPIGYYKDPEKSARTFVQVDGDTYSIPGDYAMVEADGSLTLLGRGSVVINTGGEKVFPEEVENALKSHPEIFDAVVVGVPDERWGERIIAVIQPRVGTAPTLESVQDHCRKHVAGYKIPRGLCAVDEMVRSPAGKSDYRWAKAQALESEA
jgi:fatty-acyl-CoA synthase